MDLNFVSFEFVSFLLFGHDDFSERLSMFSSHSENSSILDNFDIIGFKVVVLEFDRFLNIFKTLTRGDVNGRLL